MEPSPSMRRTPPGGPPVAVAIAEPEDAPRSFWLRLLELAARLRRSRRF